MSELHRPDDTDDTIDRTPPKAADPAAPSDRILTPAPAIFTAKPSEGLGVPLIAWGVAGLVILVVIAGLLFATRGKPALPKTIQPLAAYAANLPMSQFTMSESTSLSGGKSTFIDGHIKNTNTQTVTGITVQVLFRNEEGMPPQIETMPLSFIRTRQPYIDTEPVSAAPLKPGAEQDFRLIFESIPQNWNSQMPEIHIIQVATE